MMGFPYNFCMNWDSPLPTKLFVGAASVVLVIGWVVAHMYQTPTLLASPGIVAVTDAEVRDAVASPVFPMAAGGWFGAAGAAAWSRVAHVPSVLSPLKWTMPPRQTSGRAAFSGRRVIVDRVNPGIPEPGFSLAR